MAPISRAAWELAERLLAAGAAGAASTAGAGSPLAGASLADRCLATELSRWFGAYGYHALVTRALARARADHPALDAVQIGPATAPALDGLSDAVRVHGAGAVVAGVSALLAALLDLLARLVGEDLVGTFVERTILAMAPDVAADAPTSRTSRRPSPEKPA